MSWSWRWRQSSAEFVEILGASWLVYRLCDAIGWVLIRGGFWSQGPVARPAFGLVLGLGPWLGFDWVALGLVGDLRLWNPLLLPLLTIISHILITLLLVNKIIISHELSLLLLVALIIFFHELMSILLVVFPPSSHELSMPLLVVFPPISTDLSTFLLVVLIIISLNLSTPLLVVFLPFSTKLNFLLFLGLHFYLSSKFLFIAKSFGFDGRIGATLLWVATVGDFSLIRLLLWVALLGFWHLGMLLVSNLTVAIFKLDIDVGASLFLFDLSDIVILISGKKDLDFVFIAFL